MGTTEVTVPSRATDDTPPVAVQPIVRVAGVNHSFGQGEARNQILFNISVEIMPAQLVVLSGPSGAGKTTLLTLIGALRAVQEGRIEVLGYDLSHLDRHQLAQVRQSIGFIFQTHNLFPSLSAYENVMTAMQLAGYTAIEMRRRGVEILERLGLGSRIDHKPRSLSTGECQRVAIARALVNRPRLVLADEPTAALDRHSTLRVVDLLKEMTSEYGAAVLMVTHDHRIIERADRLIRLVDGRITSDLMLRDVAKICDFLRNTNPFETVSPSQLTEIAQSMERRHFAPGETVVRVGDVADKLFLLARGTARIVRDNQLVAYQGSGDFFGEEALLSGQPHSANLVAEKDLETYVLSRDEVRDLMETNASFREQLYRIASLHNREAKP
jgi:putative ABC transport system ATP-binding protein